MKKIAILTSGGDCAGLNAIIRAVTYRAIRKYGWKVFGIRNGTMGLLKRPLEFVEIDCMLGGHGDTLLRMGGTILGTTNKGNPFKYPQPDGSFKDRSEEIIAGFRELELDALIGIGGDGSQRILHKIATQGKLPFVAIPKTIDNDLGLTENSVGFSTAVEVATEALDRLQPTAASHDRVMILEVMGRDAGHIALTAGIAGGADIILIPEIPYKIKNLANKISELRKEGRNFSLVVVAEAVKTESGVPVVMKDPSGQERYGGIGHYLGERLQEVMGVETRVTVLGHVQRGGQPDFRDRLIASAFGVHAVDLIAAGKSDRMVAWQNREVVDVSVTEAINEYQEVDVSGTLVHTAKGLGISFGDNN
ncbi:MAG: ATP-dependent 6-phosphofructokinase [Alphaproteobacteria bacterium]|nr:ATP-dependent 6-phosphofructokinase [Alphaproteobacteria bacterium]MBT5389196.1 ATP-dependent 6-phosphofructokinase [Alphaproteobacteria bacterium]MBT5540376.1 ATP-dependent 6-phosphofructokinase [Alphaproteobacteria bacterium]